MTRPVISHHSVQRASHPTPQPLSDLTVNPSAAFIALLQRSALVHFPACLAEGLRHSPLESICLPIYSRPVSLTHCIVLCENGHPRFCPKLSGNESLFLIFNSIFDSFIFRNKADYCIPGYYFAYGYHYCFLELHF